MKRKLAVFIPARGGSKGILKKNLASFCGKPLVDHSIDHALSVVKDPRDIWLSSDSNEILYRGIVKNINTIRRKEKLAQDNSKISDVILDWLYTNEIFRNYKYFIMLQPTYPLRIIKDIHDCMDQVFEQQVSKAVAVTPAKQLPHELVYVNNATGNGEIIGRDNNSTNRQDHPECFFITGSFYVSLIDDFLKHPSFFSQKTIYYPTNEPYSVDIDNSHDLILAETIYKYLTANKS